MRRVGYLAVIAVLALPNLGVAADEPQDAGLVVAAAAATLTAADGNPGGAAAGAGAPVIGLMPALHAAAQSGNATAQVELGVKYAHAEGVPKDSKKANQLFCQAAKYGYAEGLYNLGWSYANGRGVLRDDGIAARLFNMAAERGHEHASRLLTLVPGQGETDLPACMQPDPLPVAKALPPRPVAAEYDDQQPQNIPMAPKAIMQLVERHAPQYEVDANLALALISVESAFNTMALSPARAQGLMQLIPETAERFGVKRPFDPDENIKGGLAYLRWLLAYFQGDVSLVLAAYNAGEGAVEKFRGIPPYNETRDYVKKITAMYRRLTHPYNSSVVKPSPLIEQLKRNM